MITMRNYPKLGSYILIDNNNNYSIERAEDRKRTTQGVGGITEDGQIVGIYVKDKKLFFFYNGQSLEVPVNSLSCTNNYVSKLERCFSATINNQVICNIVYEPFIDPGMIYYDAEPDEFDVLLYLSGLLKNEDSIKNFITGMEMIEKRDRV